MPTIKILDYNGKNSIFLFKVMGWMDYYILQFSIEHFHLQIDNLIFENSKEEKN